MGTRSHGYPAFTPMLPAWQFKGVKMNAVAR